MRNSTKALMAAALVANAGAATGAYAQSFGNGAGQASEQQQRQQSDNRGGQYTTDGQSRQGQRFDDSANRNSQRWSQPRQNQNGYDQYQNFDPNEVYLPTQVSGRPVQCNVNSYGVRNPGFMAAVTVADANTCRPIVSTTGSRDFVTVYDYGYEGRGMRQIKISLRNYQVTAVSINGAQLPPQYGEALMDRPLAGIEMGRTSMDGYKRPEVKSIRQWIGLGF